MKISLLRTSIKEILHINSNSTLLFFFGLSSILLFAPFNFFLLGFITFPYLAKQIFKAKDYFTTLNCLFYFFFGFYIGNYYWISFSFLVNKNYILLFPLIFLLIPLYFTILSTIFVSIIYYIKDRFKLNILQFFLSYSLLLCLHEYCRGHITPFIDFKGLPWNLLGYSIANNFLLQIISVIGIYGLTFIIIYLFNSFIFIFAQTSKKTTILTLAINIITLLSLYLFGFYHINNSKMEAISQDNILLLHTNTSKHHGYNTEKVLENITQNIALLNANKSPRDIIIFPEGTIPVATEENKNPAIEYILENIKKTDFHHLIIGSPRMENINGLTRYFNSIMTVDSTGKIQQHYNKFNLVPFGEYIPYFNILPRLAAQKNFTKGNELKTLSFKDSSNKIISYVPLICYDAIFSGKMSQNGNFLLNITNDIWFTRKISNFNISLGTWHHFDHARYRSIEEGKPLIRVANYGITALIDSFGRIISKVDYKDSEQSIIINLPDKIQTPTFFNKYRNLISHIFIIINIIIYIFSFLIKTLFNTNHRSLLL